MSSVISETTSAAGAGEMDSGTEGSVVGLLREEGSSTAVWKLSVEESSSESESAYRVVE